MREGRMENDTAGCLRDVGRDVSFDDICYFGSDTLGSHVPDGVNT